ncbi:Vacuolar protein sorting-associated protein 41 [Clarireedia jacksonii]
MAERSEDQDDTTNMEHVESSQAGTDGTEDEEDTVGTESEEDDDEEEEEEPKLKYARITSHLGPIYRNGDATSTFLVAGDKMFIGTHNGNIHVLSLPSFTSLRVYHAHSASVTSISISPFPPPLLAAVPEAVQRTQAYSDAPKTPQRAPSMVSQSSTNTTRSPRAPPVVPNIPSNAIYIGTSSVDGKVCIASLVDIKDVQLRDFARPVQTVGLSPDYKNDRTYVSGGLAGNLVLTVGGRAGTSSTSTTTGTAAATASGWLGTIGLGTNAGKDTILHSGEGTINTVKWSLSGKYVAWSNEHGIKIMRSHLHLEGQDAEAAWKRIGHIARPDGEQWEEMASVWKTRIEWIDEKSLETDEDDKTREAAISSPAIARFRLQASKDKARIEKLLVGWGGTIWMIHVHPGVGKNAGEQTVGSAEIVKMLRMDCIISGLSLYTPTLLVVLAYVMPDENEEEEVDTPKGHKSQGSTSSTGSGPSGGIRRRQNALSPELRLIDLETSQEVDTDGLTVSRYERLSASDYHLCVLPAARNQPVVQTPRSTLETLTGMGSGLWNATINATALLSSSASIISTGSKSDGDSKGQGSIHRAKIAYQNRIVAAHPHIITPGMKIFIHSPYDCILATKRDLSDHLSWLLEHERHQEAWELIDEHPEVISSSPEKLSEIGPGTLDPVRSSSDDFYDNESTTIESASRLINSSVEKEKRRIGELWIQSLIENNDWTAAGKICGKVLGTSDRWEQWVWTFAGKDKFDEITNYIPTVQIKPPLPSTIYEVVLGHYIAHNRPRVRELLEQWSPDLFDVKAVITALENQLKYRDVRQDSVEDGETGRDWRIVMESLGKLYVADGRPRDALKCYIQLQDADAAMSLVKQYHLVDAVADDIPGLVMLRVSKEQRRNAPIPVLREATSEAIKLLVDEAHHGLLKPQTVVNQLEHMPLYLFFYVSSLWRGDGIDELPGENRDRLLAESRALVDGLADLAVHLFATYDRDLLMEFLKSSTFYTFEKATTECENHSYIPELVYLYSKTGQTKRALYLIIDRLADVSQAIAFAKSQNDADLWEDLLNYSMDKPRFIRGLLEEVGTAIDPITLVRRIPEGLEIEGLREGLSKMIKEYEIQESISQGVARVLRGEVAMAQNRLRAGQRRGVKFDIVEQDLGAPSDVQQLNEKSSIAHKPGHCVGCKNAFDEEEMETLVGFTCGHVWHLTHLLNYGKNEHGIQASTDEERRNNFDGLGDRDEEQRYANVHSIGAKVTRARLLRDRIRGGCPLCKEKNDAHA